MGLFCVNFHFRNTDKSSLTAALHRRGIKRFHVLPTKSGWTSLYEEHASHQDDARIRSIACELSRDLKVSGIAFLVHDSDIACYWIFDNGKLIDDYNSCPDYFDAGAGGSGPSGGDPELLLPFCRSGVDRDELTAILTQDTVFAEGIIEQLAELLGIDAERALSDYRDLTDGEFGGPGGPDGPDDFGDDDDGGGGDDSPGDDEADDADGSPSTIPFRSANAGQIAELIGAANRSAPVDAGVAALVQAAAADNIDEIDRLLKQGVSIDAEAPGPLPGDQPLAGLGKLVAGVVARLTMTPLLAAVMHQHRRAVERLLSGGADPNRIHALFGTAVHAATAVGNSELLAVLLDHGGSPTKRNAQGQTALQVINMSRGTLDRLAQAQAMMKSMGVRIPGVVDQLSKITLPTEGWDACEQLLRDRGAS